MDQQTKEILLNKIDGFVSEKADIMNQKGWLQTEEAVQDFLNELGSFLLERLNKDVKEPTTEDIIEIEKKNTNAKGRSHSL